MDLRDIARRSGIRLLLVAFLRAQTEAAPEARESNRGDVHDRAICIFSTNNRIIA